MIIQLIVQRTTRLKIAPQESKNRCTQNFPFHIHLLIIANGRTNSAHASKTPDQLNSQTFLKFNYAYC